MSVEDLMRSMISLTGGPSKESIDAAGRMVDAILSKGRDYKTGYSERVIEQALVTLGKMFADSIHTTISNNNLVNGMNGVAGGTK